MPALRPALAMLAALATVGFAASARAQSVAPSEAPTAPSQPAEPHASLAEADREEARYRETRVQTMRVALHILAEQENIERTSTLAITLGLGAGTVVGGALGIQQRDFSSVLFGGLLVGLGSAILLAAPVRYALAGGSGYAPLREYAELTLAQTPPQALEAAMVRHWNEQISREHISRAASGLLYGGAGIASSALGIYFGVRESRSSGGVSASFVPLITGLTAVGVSGLALSVWFFASAGPAERGLAQWRRHSSPPARGVSIAGPTLTLTSEVRALGLTGSF